MCSGWVRDGILGAALVTASRGWFVFPCRGKLPLTRHGFKAASVESADIETWWAEYPDATIGVSCGQSGLVVLDLDKKPGVDGETMLHDILGGLGAGWPDTLTSRTPSGGLHLFFRHDHTEYKIANSASMIAPGIDVRGDGGYVITPPSCSEAGEYAWVDPDKGLISLPSWAIKLISDSKRGRKRVVSGSKAGFCGKQGKAWGSGTGAAFLSEQVRLIVDAGEGRRNVQLNESAFLVGIEVGEGHIDKVDAVQKLRGAGIGAGLPSPEVERTLSSGLNAGLLRAEELSLPLTEMGNAMRLINTNGDHLKFCAPLGGWLAWDGRRWADQAEPQVMEFAKKNALGMFEEANAKGIEALAKWGRSSQGFNNLRNTLLIARSDEMVRVDDPEVFDASPNLLNVANGIFDLETGLLRPHRPEDLMTRLASVHFDREAVCPRWIEFLGRVQDEDTIRFLQRAVGYSMSGVTSEQCLFFLHGNGANGKSVFINTISALLGSYARCARPETFCERNSDGATEDVARLRGSRFVSTSETRSRRLDEALVKAFTGQDEITARRLYENSTQFIPTAKLWLYGNEKPLIVGTDDGIWRRIVCVPFKVHIPREEQDRSLAKMLRNELSGILNWAHAGYMDWCRNGLGLPAALIEATASYRGEMDPIQPFIDECCNVMPLARERTSSLYRCYQGFCGRLGERPVGLPRFGESLAHKGFPTTSSGGRMIRLGICLRPSTESLVG